MLSFTGVPPTLGFLGKFYLFRTVLEGGYAGLALVGVLASLISAYYYLRVVVVMYMREGEPAASQDPWLRLVAYGSAICVVLLGIFSDSPPAPGFSSDPIALLAAPGPTVTLETELVSLYFRISVQSSLANISQSPCSVLNFQSALHLNNPRLF